jgi:hypothetical protein
VFFLQTNGSGVLSFSSVPSEVKAWVNFNGTGTVAIRASFNVSSITDRGTGAYTVNFTNALTDANYSTVSMTQEDTGGGGRGIAGQGTPTTSSRSVDTFNLSNVAQDHQFITLGFLR